MESFLKEMVDEFTKDLPAKLVRLLFIITIIGAALLHITSTRRISALELSNIEVKSSQSQLNSSIKDLTNEVRGYRIDILEQNKELRRLVNEKKHKE